MGKRINVVVVGALGRMGSAAIQAFSEASDRFNIICGIVRDLKGLRPGTIESFAAKGITLSDNLEAELHKGNIDVLIELTTPDSVFRNSKLALQNGVRPVIGATGLSDDDIKELERLCLHHQTGAIIAPNFAIGAVLMMRLAGEIAKYMPSCEIIELHHDKKLDSPSGTAIKTAKLISSNFRKQSAQNQTEPCRGGNFYGIPIHSIRLPGLVAHQEIIFGGQGQTLSIRHDSIDRSSFMPGILLATSKVINLNSLVYGLEKILD